NFASSEQFEFDLDGERELLQVTPYRDDYGLDWLIVTIIPESDFTSQIHENNRSTILLIIASLFASILLATFMTDWVTRPILRLSQSVKAIAHGNWSEPVPVNRQDEVGELARSFNDMAQQLKKAFASLQASEERYRNLFAGVPIGLYRSTQAGEILDANLAAVHLFGYPNLETLIAVNASDLYVNQGDRTRWRDTI